MTQEQKATAYDEAVKRAKKEKEKSRNLGLLEFIEDAFPELKESEDERIRDEIVLYIGAKDDISLDTHNKWLSWLEKQGEPKLSEDLGEYIAELSKQFPEVSFAKLSRIAVRVKNWLEKKHKFIIGDTISNDKIVYRVDNIVKNAIGQDCYFLVNIESEKNGTRYCKLHYSDGSTRNSGETTWLCEQVDAKFEKKFVVDFKAEDWYVSKVDGKIRNIYHSVDKVEPKFKVGDLIRLKNGDGLEWTIKEIHHDGYYTIVCEDRDDFIYLDDRWELVGKLVDKNGPKFKIGDWIVCEAGEYTSTLQIIDIKSGYYWFHDDSYLPVVDEDCLHLWTIQDAKDGDVLIDKSGSREGPFIFKETKPSDIKTNMLNPLTVLGYCGIGGAGFTKGSGWGDTANCIYYPATKEQRELLFKRMHEAGYEWNADKKELKKINSYCQEHCKGYQETGKCFVDGGCNAKREAEKIENTSPLLSDFFNAEYERGKADALKCAEWSEEDELQLQAAIEICENSGHTITSDWLKSLRQRIGWKPSKEQMEALKASYFYWNGITKEIPYAEKLESLYEQLKKLTE